MKDTQQISYPKGSVSWMCFQNEMSLGEAEFLYGKTEDIKLSNSDLCGRLGLMIFKGYVNYDEVISERREEQKLETLNLDQKKLLASPFPRTSLSWMLFQDEMDPKDAQRLYGKK